VRVVGILAELYVKNIIINININKRGNSNKIQDRIGAPALQIRFRIQVHTIM